MKNLFLLFSFCIFLISCDPFKKHRPFTYILIDTYSDEVRDKSGEIDHIRFTLYPENYLQYCNAKQIPSDYNIKKSYVNAFLIFKIYNDKGEEIYKKSGIYAGSPTIHIPYFKEAAFFRAFHGDEATGLEVSQIDERKILSEQEIRGDRNWRYGSSCFLLPWGYYNENRAFYFLLPRGVYREKLAKN